jgi:hypothetical protein
MGNMEREQSDGRRSFLKKTVLFGAPTGIIAASTPVVASSSYNDNIKNKADEHGETESSGENDESGCGSSSSSDSSLSKNISTNTCSSDNSDRWKAFFEFEDGYDETQYGIRSSEREVTAETKYDSSGGETFDIYLSDDDIDDFRDHIDDVQIALAFSAGDHPPTADETVPENVTVGSRGTSTKLYDPNIEYGNVDIGGRVSGVLDDSLINFAEYAAADWMSGGRAEASLVSNLAGGSYAWAEAFAHIDVSGNRSAEADIQFKGNWEASMFATLGSAKFGIDGFIREVTDEGTSRINRQEMIEREEQILSNNGTGLTDPSYYNPFWYDEGGFSDDSDNVMPISNIEPGKEYHVGIRLRADTETFTRGPGTGRVHVSDFNNETNNKKGNLDEYNTNTSKQNYADLNTIEIKWE